VKRINKETTTSTAVNVRLSQKQPG